MNDSPYTIRYTVEFGEFFLLDAKPDQGLTKSLVVISCLEHADGSYSQVWKSYDGKTKGDMPSRDVYKAWILMAHSLREKDDLPDSIRDFVRVVWETWREAILS